jgi:hypothetical protein
MKREEIAPKNGACLTVAPASTDVRNAALQLPEFMRAALEGAGLHPSASKPRSQFNRGLPVKKSVILSAVFAAALPLLAHAESISFPSDAPIASVTIPDSWGPEETETGIQATSDDNAIYFSIDIADEKSTDKVISDAVDFLTKNGVTIDQKTQKDAGNSEINGMEFTALDWDGNDEDGPVSVGLGFLSPKRGKMLVITYWGTKGDEDKHDEEVAKIVHSLKPAS